jgi:N-acetyl-gamma-glutamyl-phosphate reductase
MSTIYAHVTPELAAKGSAAINDQLDAAFSVTYSGKPFVHLAGAQLPSIKDVAYSNYTALGWVYNELTGVVTVISVIDNMLKGAAGQAMENFNLLFGFPQATAIPQQPAII